MLMCASLGEAVLEGHGLKMDQQELYNPEWDPDGNEGGVDTNSLPWLPLSMLPGCSIKPLRASRETGSFVALFKVAKGFAFPKTYYLGASDSFVLSGNITFPNGPMSGSMGAGYWGYVPGNVVIEGAFAEEDTEYLATHYAPVAWLDAEDKIMGMLTGKDIRTMAAANGLSLLPNTLAEALQNKPPAYTGAAEPLACMDGTAQAMNGPVQKLASDALSTGPHFVDTNTLPWIVNPEAPEIGLKVMRISAETGFVSLIVRQNGQAAPHYHLGPADFFITNGRIGYRAGPKEGYGPGTYMFEPAGARHEATQRVTEDDLIYTANLYGPIQFDSGVGTPILLVQSWMQYLEAANAFNTPLLKSTFPDDESTLLQQGHTEL